MRSKPSRNFCWLASHRAGPSAYRFAHRLFAAFTLASADGIRFCLGAVRDAVDKWEAKTEALVSGHFEIHRTSP